MPNEHNALPTSELLPMMDKLIEQGFNVFVKWTCPNCGERVTSLDANTFHTAGYMHDECGHLYTGDEFGIMLHLDFGGKDDASH